MHDYIKEYGGAERVLEALHEVFPDAPVFTTVYLPDFLGPHRERFAKWDIKTSFLQFFPLKSKLISPIRLVAPFVFKTFDFSKFDIIIVSATGAYSPNSIRTTINNSQLTTNKKKPIQICYCHTPPRYLYGFATAREWKNNPIFKVLGEFVNHFLRLADYKSSENVDFFVANSKNIAGRIKKFYRKDSTVIYPPVEIGNRKQEAGSRNKNHNSKFMIHDSGYFLAGGRLARPKHVDLIIDAFVKLDLPLKIFGRGFAGFEEEIKNKIANIKNTKIELLGEVSDEEKITLMQNAKAFVIAAEDEDFGITPVEAMSVGTPVIAYRSGGILETVVEEATGLFFDDLTVASLSDTIKRFEKTKFDPEYLKKHAQKFSKERFKKEILNFVKNLKF